MKRTKSFWKNQKKIAKKSGKVFRMIFGSLYYRPRFTFVFNYFFQNSQNIHSGQPSEWIFINQKLFFFFPPFFCSFQASAVTYEGVEKLQSVHDSWKIFRNCSKSFRVFRNLFVRFVLSKTFQNKLRRDDSFDPKIVEIGAILAIFRPFETFQQKITSLDRESHK